MKLISVILPVYNVAPYLEQCVQSILNQTYTNLEIILIDDGSTDGSNVLCDKLQKADKRINVFHQKNRGVSAARNAGINNASGYYISFIDPDDYIDSNFYEILIKNMEECNAQCSSVGHRRLYEEDGKTVIVSPARERRILSGLEAMDETNSGIDTWVGMPINKLYLRKLIEEYRLRFREDITYNEDDEFCYRYLSHCEITVRESIPLYTYRIRKTSATFSMFSTYENSKKSCYAVDIIFDFAKQYKDRIFYMRIAEYYVKTYTKYIYYMFSQNIYDPGEVKRAQKNIYAVKKELSSIRIPRNHRIFLLGVAVSPRLTYLGMRVISAMRGKKQK